MNESAADYAAWRSLRWLMPYGPDPIVFGPPDAMDCQRSLGGLLPIRDALEDRRG